LAARGGRAFQAEIECFSRNEDPIRDAAVREERMSDAGDEEM